MLDAFAGAANWVCKPPAPGTPAPGQRSPRAPWRKEKQSIVFARLAHEGGPYNDENIYPQDLLMPASDQGVTRDRYTIIPRTAIFLRRGQSYLLLKGASTKRLWANKYNGLGGHVEKGEDVHGAAVRELLEETGLAADLWLCGTLIVDAGEMGIGLYIFSGECPTGEGEPQPSKEGWAEWVQFEDVSKLPLVEDLPVLLSRIHAMKRGDVPFSARSHYDESGKLIVEFAE